MRLSTRKATGRGSFGKTSEPASSSPSPAARRRLATPVQCQSPRQPSPSPSAEKSITALETESDSEPKALAGAVSPSASAAPVAAPAAITWRRVSPSPRSACPLTPGFLLDDHPLGQLAADCMALAGHLDEERTA